MQAPEVDQKSPSYGLLCDLIASGDIVAVTGAGVSAGLKRAGSDEGVPGWQDLLLRLLAAVKHGMDAGESDGLKHILETDTVSTQCFVEVASRIREVDPIKYRDELLRQVRTEPGQHSRTHAALVDLEPRGTITFNYDDCHETAFQVRNVGVPRVVTPYSEDELVALLKNRLLEPFLLKAHGDINDAEGRLVLDWNSYRSLLAKEPTYRAFFQHVLTNLNCLFVGFGLSDPDFDMFVDSIASAYGSPVSEHVAIRHVDQASTEEFLWKRRYGIDCLHVSDYSIIPGLITEASHTAGHGLKQKLEAALSNEMAQRRSAHKFFAQLGPHGVRTASEALKSQLNEETDEFRVSEIVYSLGVIDPKRNKETIMSVVANDKYSSAKPAARALTQLRSALTLNDMGRIHGWKSYYQSRQFADDPGNRLEQYCDYYLIYIPAKFSSDPD